MSKNRQAASEAAFSPMAALPEAVAAVIAAIETDVIRGRILPRNRLIEDHLMEDYEAKRHVVRSALTELQRLGVVVKPPHRGAEIRRFDPDSLAALYRMREVLHQAAVAMIIFPIDPRRIAALRQACALHADATNAGDPIAIHRTNMRFHRLFYGLCDNPYLAESIRLHDWLSFPARAYGIASADGQQQARAEARGAGAHREHDGDDDVRHQQTDGEPEADVAVEAGDEGQEGPAPAQQHDDADHQTQQQRPARGVGCRWHLPGLAGRWLRRPPTVGPVARRHEVGPAHRPIVTHEGRTAKHPAAFFSVRRAWRRGAWPIGRREPPTGSAAARRPVETTAGH